MSQVTPADIILLHLGTVGE